MITAIVMQWIQYQMNKFSPQTLSIFFADCMKPLLRSEGFHPGRHIRVSSEHEDFGDRRRVVKDGDPWCTSSGDSFGEWVQVDLGKTSIFRYPSKG